MDFKTLLGLLDIESPEEFEYFENFADLIEMDADIPSEILYELVSKVPEKLMGELISEYFDDILEHMQEDEAELYTLLEMIKRALAGFGTYADEERKFVVFADEIVRFRDWFKFERNVSCQDASGNKLEDLSVFEAVMLYRSDKFDNPGGAGYTFDFENSLGYKLDEYILSFSDYPDEDEEFDDESDDENENFMH